MGILDFFFGKPADVKTLIAGGATVVDVRTRSEFAAGHKQGSINIPLDELEKNLEKIKKMRQPIVVCCASGMRSGRAAGFLRKKGLNEVYNGGGWTSLI